MDRGYLPAVLPGPCRRMARRRPGPAGGGPTRVCTASPPHRPGDGPFGRELAPASRGSGVPAVDLLSRRQRAGGRTHHAATGNLTVLGRGHGVVMANIPVALLQINGPQDACFSIA